MMFRNQFQGSVFVCARLRGAGFFFACHADHLTDLDRRKRLPHPTASTGHEIPEIANSAHRPQRLAIARYPRLQVWSNVGYGGRGKILRTLSHMRWLLIPVIALAAHAQSGSADLFEKK